MSSKINCIAILSLIFLLAGCRNVNKEKYFNSPPKDSWEEIYFESINELTKALDLTELRKTKVAPDSIEIRIWSGFGITSLSGIVLKKDKGIWTGHSISGAYREIDKLPPPTSGWEILWNDLRQLGILTLPDSSQLRDEVLAFDGTSYVIEFITENQYRTYMYPNPDVQEWPEAKSVLKIIERIGNEFDKRPTCVKKLHEACFSRDLSKMHELLVAGCNPDWPSPDRYSLLHITSNWGWVEGTELLLRYSKLINQQTIRGRTPLHEAVFIDNYGAVDRYAKTIKLLLETGADLNLRDKNGQTALELAVSLGHEGRADLIREKMKR